MWWSRTEVPLGPGTVQIDPVPRASPALSGVSGLGHGGYHQGRLLFNDEATLALLITVVPDEQVDALLSGLRTAPRARFGSDVCVGHLRQPAGVLPMSADRTKATDTRSRARGTRPSAMVGAGQLARMTHQAATSLGVRAAGAPADSAATRDEGGGRLHHRVAPTIAGRPRARDGCDVLTFDHEQVPPTSLETLEPSGCGSRSTGPHAKLMAQDKLHAPRRFTRSVTRSRSSTTPLPSPDCRRFSDRAGVAAGRQGRRAAGTTDGASGRSPISKTRATSWPRTPGGLLLEPLPGHRFANSPSWLRVPRSGETACYPVVETVQRDGDVPGDPRSRRVSTTHPREQPNHSRLDIAEDIDAVGRPRSRVLS